MSITYASLATLQKFQQEVDSRYAKKFTLGLAKQSTATSGYAATYKLTLDGVQVGDAINIPKDFLVKSATVETCATADTPVTGLAVGDKYIDFVVNSVENDDTASHIYLPVQDLVDIYTSGNGVNVSAGNVISAVVDSSNANGLSVGANGIALATVVASESGVGGSNGAMTAAQAEKLAGLDNYSEGNGIDITNRVVSVDIDSTNANGLATTQDGLKIGLADGTHNGALSSTDWTNFNTAYGRSVATPTGDGNVITAIGIDSTTKDITVTKGITALQESDFVAISDAEVTALWASGGNG